MIHAAAWLARLLSWKQRQRGRHEGCSLVVHDAVHERRAVPRVTAGTVRSVGAIAFVEQCCTGFAHVCVRIVCFAGARLLLPPTIGNINLLHTLATPPPTRPHFSTYHLRCRPAATDVLRPEVCQPTLRRHCTRFKV